MPVERLKQHILEQIAEAGRKAFGQAPEGLEIGFPPDLQLGHFAVGCFPPSKKLRKSPAEIANTLAAAISADEVIESATAAGPYINFMLANRVFCGNAIDTILAAGDRYGDVPLGRNQRVMVEYLSPNTNKPLHLGHLRNAALGISVSRLLDATGHWLTTA